MHWKTAISTHRGEELYIRGTSLVELIQQHTFTETICLLWRGSLPTEAERTMLDACLVSVIEHSVAVPTAFVPRSVISVGNPMTAAVAAGVLSVGDYHGGALEGAMKLLSDERDAETLVADYLGRKQRLPGLGHKLYKDKDPRAEQLFEKAATVGFPMATIEKARAIHAAFHTQSDKQLPLNVDMAIAAILVQLGLSPDMGKAFFAFARVPGMIAHATEELQNEKPFRRFSDEDITYDGA